MVCQKNMITKNCHFVHSRLTTGLHC